MSQRQQRTELELHKERCFLISAIYPRKHAPGEAPLDELACLVDTAGGEVIGELTQKLDRPHPRTYFGKGKYEELADLAIAAEADTIVVDDDLSPTQLGAIEDACRRKVIDRNEVILDIFCSRARSHQAKLQVELAQLQYEMPRLARKWTHLERLGGGIGTRGPGESQIETDRRLIRGKIAALRRELDRIEERKIREVENRHDCFTASLVGYTNAGKSTLLNALTGADAFVEDRLFATLDTLTRRLELDDGLTMLLSDTVGFIRRLPHHLIASFHATLEEAAQADLLLHVIDGADPLARTQIESVAVTLAELGMQNKERLYVFNKCDQIRETAVLDALRGQYEPNIVVSAKTGAGLDEFRALLQERACASSVTATLRFPAGDGKRFALINELAQVRDTRYDGADVIVQAVFTGPDLARIQSLPGPIEVVS